MQLDLFDHSRDVMLRNDVAAALRNREMAAAAQGLAVLSAEFPDDELLAPLTELSQVLAWQLARFTDRDAALQAHARMDDVVVPAARRVFGAAEAGRWLAPVWRSMAAAADALAFDVKRPKAHAASMLLRARDWSAAVGSIERIPAWRRIPGPLAWMAEARFAIAGLEAAWPFLVELAWDKPALFADLAGRLPAPGLRALLQRFAADSAFLEEESGLAWFPAWLLVAEPSSLPVFREVMQRGNKPPERAARIVMQLLISERRGGQRVDVALRKGLMALHAGLFERYKATR